MRSFLLLALLLSACDPSAGDLIDPDLPEGPLQPDPDASLQDPRLGRSCADSLEGPAKATLGQLVDGMFVELEDAELAVHAGGQGGYHSDLLILLEGDGADQGLPDGLDLSIDMAPGDWTETLVADLNPQCFDLPFKGYVAPARVFWWGPEGEHTVEETCGVDPCDDPAATDQACWDYIDCVDFESGVPWGVVWSDFTRQTATVWATVDASGFYATTAATDVVLVQGEQEPGG